MIFEWMIFGLNFESKKYLFILIDWDVFENIWNFCDGNFDIKF